MSKHAELIERVMNVPCYTEEDAKALAAIADALEAQAREIEGLRKGADRAEQMERLARYMFEADNYYGAGFSSDPNWRLWYTRLADLVGVKLESAP